MGTAQPQRRNSYNGYTRRMMNGMRNHGRNYGNAMMTTFNQDCQNGICRSYGGELTKKLGENIGKT